MSFAAPLLLLCLLAVPAAIAGYLWLDDRRDARAAAWAPAPLLPNMVARPPAWRRHLPVALLLVGLTLLLVGFARPKATITVEKQDATVVLVLDVSGSMAANDSKPTRLAAARAAALRYVDDLPKGYRMSVITFSDHTTLASPPTHDLDRVPRRSRPRAHRAAGHGARRRGRARRGCCAGRAREAGQQAAAGASRSSSPTAGRRPAA